MCCSSNRTMLLGRKCIRGNVWVYASSCWMPMGLILARIEHICFLARVDTDLEVMRVAPIWIHEWLSSLALQSCKIATLLRWLIPLRVTLDDKSIVVIGLALNSRLLVGCEDLSTDWFRQLAAVIELLTRHGRHDVFPVFISITDLLSADHITIVLRLLIRMATLLHQKL